MVINKIEVIQAFRTTLLDAEIVDVIATGKRIGIRDGVYNALLHTRPDAPAERPICTATNTEFIERPFDEKNFDIYFSEAFLPSLETPSASYVDLLAGIMQYNVHVPSKNGNRFDIQNLYDYGKYIADIFDPKLDNINVGGLTTEMVIDSVSIAPLIRDDIWNMLPISINFRVYEYE